ncbi:hypothetical protein [Synechococcus phage BUCT-ZZ01]|nr:hypothetical protein [Synechococcus phage BUCT-ZZ01]
MKIKALGTKVLITQHEEKKAEGSIIIKETVNNTKARVLSVGDKVTEVSEGDIIFVEWKEAKPISGDKRRVFIDVKHIIAVVE